MGKILIVNTGPARFDSLSGCAEDNNSAEDESLIQYANAAAERLAEYQLNAVYTVMLPEAIKTAEAIAGRLNLETQLMPEPSGLENIASFRDNLEATREKISQELDLVAEKHKKDTVVIVSNPLLSVIMILHLLHMHNKHFGQIVQDAGAISLFEVRFGVPSALIINDTCHLHGLK